MLVPMVLSCVNEVIEEPGDGLVVKTFTGYSDMETKTSIDNEFNILWDEEDHITVFAGDGKGTVFSDVAVSDDCTVAEFTGKIDLVDTYYALYPAQDAAVYASDGEKITAELPSLQTALAGSFADEMNLAVAKTLLRTVFHRILR